MARQGRGTMGSSNLEISDTIYDHTWIQVLNYSVIRTQVAQASGVYTGPFATGPSQRLGGLAELSGPAQVQAV